MSTIEKVIKNKLGLLEFLNHLRNVSRVSKLLGYFCDSFYYFKKLCEEKGEAVLIEKNCKKLFMGIYNR